jgi:hypothetical protein
VTSSVRPSAERRPAVDGRSDEPPGISSVTQHVVPGPLSAEVEADRVYVGDGRIRFGLGQVFVVLRGREAALSMRELVQRVAPVIDELYPDPEAQAQRQHRAALRCAALEADSRARVNGTEPAAVVVARRAAALAGPEC